MTTATMTSYIQQPQPLQDNRANQQPQSHRYHVQHIGNYVIHRKTLGSGSMGTVKLAECLSDKDHQQVFMIQIYNKPCVEQPIKVIYLASMQ
jgi:hypothetical protein